MSPLTVNVKIGSEEYKISGHKTGQWRRDFWDRQKKRSVAYYFGSVVADPTGDNAAREFLGRLAGILEGTDRSVIQADTDSVTVPALFTNYLAQRRVDQKAGKLSSETLRDYIRELDLFADFLVQNKLGQVRVVALRPEHFAAYATHLVSSRRLSPHAEKRTKAYVKACFNWGSGNGKYPPVQFGTAFESPSTTPEAIRQYKARLGKADNSRRVLTGAEIDAITALATPSFKGMVMVSVNCGLGPKDLARLTWRHIDLESGKLDMARGKTGIERQGYLWKRTRDALLRVRTLKHNAVAIEKHGEDALVFITRKGLPYYRVEEIIKDGRLGGFAVKQAVSTTFSRLARQAKVSGVTLYRLRHTFKTMGKKARDHDALNLMMGHRERTTGSIYDHEDIEFRRVKRVALKVKGRLWPKPRREDGLKPGQTMRIVGADAA